MKTKKAETIHYGNSSNAQKAFISAKIEQELGYCQSMLVDAALQKEFFTIDDVQNIYISYEAAKESGLIDEDVIKDDYEEESQEIFEWWPINSSFFKEDLLKRGEPVLSNDYGDWWGRTCTGQSICLDPTFWDIFQDAVKRIK